MFVPLCFLLNYKCSICGHPKKTCMHREFFFFFHMQLCIYMDFWGAFKQTVMYTLLDYAALVYLLLGNCFWAVTAQAVSLSLNIALESICGIKVANEYIGNRLGLGWQISVAPNISAFLWQYYVLKSCLEFKLQKKNRATVQLFFLLLGFGKLKK